MTKKIADTPPAAALVSYRIDIAEPNTHLFHVTLTIAKPAARQRLSLPVWIPGSYLIREFAKNLSKLHARQGTRLRDVACRQIDKCSWEVDCSPARPLVVTYDVYARDRKSVV